MLEFFGHANWLPFLNNSGQEVTNFAVLRITGVTGNILDASKPDKYGAQWTHAISGPGRVAIGAKGVCTMQYPAWAAYTTGDGTPALGESWGPINADWTLRKFGAGFTIVGGPVSADARVLVMPSPFESGLGQYTATVAAGATGTVNLYYWSGATWTALSIGGQQTVPAVRNTTSVSMASAKKLTIYYDRPGGQWTAAPLEC